jgi:hypothetical protein
MFLDCPDHRIETRAARPSPLRGYRQRFAHGKASSTLGFSALGSRHEARRHGLWIARFARSLFGFRGASEERCGAAPGQHSDEICKSAPPRAAESNLTTHVVEALGVHGPAPHKRFELYPSTDITQVPVSKHICRLVTTDPCPLRRKKQGPGCGEWCRKGAEC